MGAACFEEDTVGSEDNVMLKYKRILQLLSLASALVFVNPYIFGGRVHGETHFIESLALIKFDEKIEAPDFALKDLSGNEMRLKDFRGKVIFLNFWTTWCPACLVEMPSMEKLYREFKNKDFVILAVDMQEDSETVRKFKARFKLSFPILLDTDGVVAAYYGVRGIPATYFVDREGNLYAAAMGARDWAGEDARQLVRNLLNKK
jgi:peroxiredoxin